MSKIIKIKKKNARGEDRFLSFNEDKTNILIAHNGFGKTTLIEEMKIKKPGKFITLDNVSNNIFSEEGRTYFVKDENFSFHSTHKQIIVSIQRYKNQSIRKIVDFDKFSKLTDLISESFSHFDASVDRWSRTTTTIKLNHKDEINLLWDGIAKTKLKPGFREAAIRMNEYLSEEVSTENVNFDPEYEISYGRNGSLLEVALSAEFSKIVPVDDTEEAEEFLENQQKNVNDEIENLDGIDSDMYKKLEECDYFCSAFENLDDYSRYFISGDSLEDLLFPVISYLVKFMNELDEKAIKVTEDEYRSLSTEIINTPLRRNVFDKAGEFLLLREEDSFSMGETKWISNLIFVIINVNNSSTLIFDDPIDSMDLFYSSTFLDFLHKKRPKNNIVLTHRIELPRYAAEEYSKSTKLINLFYEKIDINLFRNIANKRVIDILNSQPLEDAILFLLFMRFIFKGVDETKYNLLSNAVAKEQEFKAYHLQPILIDLVGKVAANKMVKKMKKKKIKNFCSGFKTTEGFLLSKIVWKSADSYLASMRHISETEPLGIYLMDKSKT